MLDRSVAPPHNSSFQINLTEVQTRSLDNGLLLHSLNAGTQPVIKLEVLYPSGGNYYEGKPAASLLALKMLKEGTLSYTSSQLSAHFAQYGAFIDISPSFDVPSLSLYCLSQHLSKLLPQFIEMITVPTFPITDLKRVRDIEIQQLKLQNERSNIVASKKFRNLIFGDENPYGRIITEQDLEEIKTDDLQWFHENNLSHYEIIASGQIDSKTLKVIEDSFGTTPLKTPLSPDMQHQVKPASSDITERKEEALQSSIRMGKLVVDKVHPDFIPLLITTHVLGGYFGSRLMKNIREDKGYTYGISSSLVSLKHNTWLAIGTDVKKEFAEETVAEVKMELQKLCNFPIGDKELDAVKNHMLGHFQSQLSSAFSLAEKFKDIHIHGLDYSYYDKYFKELEQIQKDKIQSLANKYLQPSSMKTVIVG